MDVDVLTKHRVKLKDNKKRDRYLDIAKEIEKLWNMKVMVNTLVVSALEIVSKESVRGLEEREIGGRAETTQTTTLLKSARILRSILKM